MCEYQVKVFHNKNERSHEEERQEVLSIRETRGILSQIALGPSLNNTRLCPTWAGSEGPEREQLLASDSHQMH